MYGTRVDAVWVCCCIHRQYFFQLFSFFSHSGIVIAAALAPLYISAYMFSMSLYRIVWYGMVLFHIMQCNHIQWLNIKSILWAAHFLFRNLLIEKSPGTLTSNRRSMAGYKHQEKKLDFALFSIRLCLHLFCHRQPQNFQKGNCNLSLQKENFSVDIGPHTYSQIRTHKMDRQ